MPPSPSLAASPALPNAVAEGLRLYGDQFARTHGVYSQYGYVYSEPGRICMFRPCKRENWQEWVLGGEADCWWVELAIGYKSLRRFWQVAPYHLPYVGWQRGLRGNDAPRFYSFDRLGTLTQWAHHE